MYSAMGFQDVKTNLKINFEINSSQNTWFPPCLQAKTFSKTFSKTSEAHRPFEHIRIYITAILKMFSLHLFNRNSKIQHFCFSQSGQHRLQRNKPTRV